MFNWDPQILQKHRSQILVENPNEVKKKRPYLARFSVLHYTQMRSQNTTENVPMKWESISLIWPKTLNIATVFFVQIHSVKLVDSGNGGGQLGKEHRKQ